jgi:hypothetical protein
MENQNYPAWKHAFTYGIYLGVALIILSLLFYVFDLYIYKWTGYVGYAIVLGFIIISSISFRDKRLNGFINYGQSFSVGFLTGLFASVIAGIFSYLFMTFVGDDYKQMMLELSEQRMLEARPDISDEELDMALKFTENMMKPWWIGVITFFGNLFFSLIFALIVSIFVKKEDNSLEATS